MNTIDQWIADATDWNEKPNIARHLLGTSHDTRSGSRILRERIRDTQNQRLLTAITQDPCPCGLPWENCAGMDCLAG